MPFRIRPDIDGDETRLRARMEADRWASFIAEKHPSDHVFIVEREGEAQA